MVVIGGRSSQSAQATNGGRPLTSGCKQTATHSLTPTGHGLTSAPGCKNGRYAPTVNTGRVHGPSTTARHSVYRPIRFQAGRRTRRPTLALVFRPHCSAQDKMRPIATDVARSVCLSACWSHGCVVFMCSGKFWLSNSL